MQRKLVKTIRATQVTSVGYDIPEPALTGPERQALARIAGRYGDELALRRSGLSPMEMSRLAFLKWMRNSAA